ncbi:MAG: alpha/beta hydrolase [Chloroflexi bacterium]|nr:MAG: alpha/beta hydrolase [Chloroflexota bacterium]
MSVSPGLGVGHEVDLSAGRIAYREAGSGPAVVFVHGLLVNGDLWRAVVPRLSDSHHCITPDLPLGGHAMPMRAGADLSPPGQARLLAELIDRLDLRDITLVGNDTGGAIVQLLMAGGDHDRIARVVLTSCDCFDIFLPRIFAPLRLLAVPGVAAVARIGLHRRLLQRLPVGFGLVTRSTLPPAIVDSYLGGLRDAGVRRDLAAVMRGLDRRHTLAAAERLPGFEKPALVAWADTDRVFPRDHGRRLAALLPRGRFVFVEDSLAFVPEDRPDRLADLIGEFVAANGGVAAAAPV